MDVATFTGFLIFLSTASGFPQDTGSVFSLPGTPCTTKEGLSGTCEGLFTCQTAMKGHSLGVMPTKCPGPFQVVICCSKEVPSVPLATEEPQQPTSSVGDACSTDAGDTGTCKSIFSCTNSAGPKCPGPINSLVCCVENLSVPPVSSVTVKPQEPTSSVGDACSTDAGDTGTCKSIFSCTSSAGPKCPGPINSLVCCLDKPLPITEKPEEVTSLVGDRCTTEAGNTGTCQGIYVCPGLKIDSITRCPGPLKSLVCCEAPVRRTTTLAPITQKSEELKSVVGDRCITKAGDTGTCKNIFSCPGLKINSITHCPGPLQSIVCCEDQSPVSQTPKQPMSLVGDHCTTEGGNPGTCENIFSCPGLDVNSVTRCPGPLKSLVCCEDKPRTTAPVTQSPDKAVSEVGSPCYTHAGDTGICRNILDCPGLTLNHVYKCPGPLSSLICCFDETPPPMIGPTSTPIDEQPQRLVGDPCFTISGQVGTCKSLITCTGVDQNPYTRCPGRVKSLVCCLQ